MDPIHAAQYNWQLVEEYRPKYRMDISGNILEGPIYLLHNDQPFEEEVSGYFKARGRWYAVNEVRWSSQPTVTWLKGVRVYFKGPLRDGGGETHIRVVRQYNSENVAKPFSIELEMT